MERSWKREIGVTGCRRATSQEEVNWGEIGRAKEEVRLAPVWRWQSGGLNFHRCWKVDDQPMVGET